MLDILYTILLFIVLFVVGVIMLIVAFALCIWATKRAKKEITDEKE